MTRFIEESVGADANLTPPVDKSGMSDERKRLFSCVEQINRAWLESMREMRRAESEFSVHLFSCSNQEEATALCEQWLARRRQIQASEQQVFEASWAELLAVLSRSSKALRRRSKGGSSAKREQ